MGYGDILGDWTHQEKLDGRL